MADEEDIPPDLERRALSRLGRFRPSVRAFVRRVNRIRWLERCGQPEPWDSEVVRIWDVEEAKAVEKSRLRPITRVVWDCLESVGRATGRYDQMMAAEEYWIARFDPPEGGPLETYHRHWPHFSSDMVGALREIVLDDVVSIRYYRESIKWYEKGHLRCAITEDGKPVVY